MIQIHFLCYKISRRQISYCEKDIVRFSYFKQIFSTLVLDSKNSSLGLFGLKTSNYDSILLRTTENKK